MLKSQNVLFGIGNGRGLYICSTWVNLTIIVEHLINLKKKI